MISIIKSIKRCGIVSIGGIRLIPFFIIATFCAQAQSLYCTQPKSSDWKYYVEGQAIATPVDKVPFWFRANQYGSIPISGLSTSFIGDIRRDYTEKKDAAFDWGVGLQLRGNVGKELNGGIIEGYVKAKASIFEIKAGRFKEIVGIVDTSLSSGAFSVSGNAFGIPQMQVGISQYQYIPFTNQLFAIKGSYAVGLSGEKGVRELYDTLATIISTKSYYQQNSIYVRLGKPDWKLSLFAGINHHVMFGDEKKIQGVGFDLSTVKTFIYAAIGKTFFPKNPIYNRLIAKVGNHIGSVDLSMQYEFEDVRLLAYRQNLYDIGALGHLANLADGIHGVSLTNKFYTGEGTEWHFLR